MKVAIKIIDREFEIVDAIEYITLADSFVKNKIGFGHGEAKLYVGNASEHLLGFFDGLDRSDCFFCKKDFSDFLSRAGQEFKDPQQEYVKKDQMFSLYDDLKKRLDSYETEFLFFKLYQVEVAPPRVYMNSSSEYYDYMRSIGLPNISYLSVLKLIGSDEKTYFYFKIFIDYKPDIEGYCYLEEERQTEEIIVKELSLRMRESLIMSRAGKGDFRNKLLKECPFCPFTMVNDERLLIASHIKPWVNSNDNEKADPQNGFLFTPTYNRLFEKGFITFNADKTLKVSPWISPMNQKRLGIYEGKRISTLPLNEKREKYLKYHRSLVFMN